MLNKHTCHIALLPRQVLSIAGFQQQSSKTASLL